MDKYNLFRFFSGFFLIIAFIILIFDLLTGGSGVSFATFSFWTLIVGINAIVTIKEKGNYIFPFVLTLGNLSVSIVLLATGQFWWGIVEWITLVLVLMSIVVWITSSGTFTIIVSTIAITIGSVPQLVLAWKDPQSISFVFWSTLLIASIFGVLAGKNWSIKERLYSVARMLVYLSVIFLGIKRFF